MKINDLATIIEDTLNEDISIPYEYDLWFKVRTYASFLDDRTLVNGNNKYNFIPCYIDSPSGSFQPLSNAIISSYQYALKMYFPIEEKEKIFEILTERLSEQFVGQIIGNEGEEEIINMGVAQFSQINIANVNEFQTWVSDLYGEKIRKSNYYIEVSIPLYLSNGKAKNGNNLALGNEFIYEISIKDNDTDTMIINNYQIIRNETTSSVVNSLQTEQLENTYLAHNVVASTNYVETFNMFIDTQTLTPNLLSKILNGNINDTKYDIYLSVYYKYKVDNNMLVNNMVVAIDKATLVARPGQLAYIQFSMVKRKE